MEKLSDGMVVAIFFVFSVWCFVFRVLRLWAVYGVWCLVFRALRLWQ